MIGWLARADQRSLHIQPTVFVTTHTETRVLTHTHTCTKAILGRGLSWADSNYSHAVLRGREKQQQSSSGTFNHVLERYNRCSKMEACRELRRPRHRWAWYAGFEAVIRSQESNAHTYVTRQAVKGTVLPEDKNFTH